MDTEVLQKIRHSIEGAQSIVINVHRNPDLDSVGSSEALSRAISLMGKEVVRISPDPIPAAFSFLTGSKDIKVVDFGTYDFSSYDLLIVIDTGSVSHLTGQHDRALPKIKKIVIDHHFVNTVPVDVRLIDTKASSSSEIVYNILKVWNIVIDQQIATSLLAGILSDTQMFRFSGKNTTVIDIVSDLMKKGGDKDAICDAMFGHMDIKKVQLYGEVLSSALIDSSHTYVTVFVDNGTYTKYGSPKGVRDSAADYLRGIEGVEFAVVGIEEKPGQLLLSFRSTGRDISKLSLSLGGGGHKLAAGATVYDSFEEAKNKVMEVVSSGH